jgi:hypothetical protein
VASSPCPKLWWPHFARTPCRVKVSGSEQLEQRRRSRGTALGQGRSTCASGRRLPPPPPARRPRPALNREPPRCCCPAELATLSDEDLKDLLHCTALQVGAIGQVLPTAATASQPVPLAPSTQRGLCKCHNALPSCFMQTRKIRAALTQRGMPVPASAPAPTAPAAEQAAAPLPAVAAPAPVPVPAPAPAAAAVPTAAEPDPRSCFDAADLARYKQLQQSIAELEGMQVGGWLPVI